MEVEKMAEEACDLIGKEINQRKQQSKGASFSKEMRRDTVIIKNF